MSCLRMACPSPLDLLENSPGAHVWRQMPQGMRDLSMSAAGVLLAASPAISPFPGGLMALEGWVFGGCQGAPVSVQTLSAARVTAFAVAGLASVASIAAGGAGAMACIPTAGVGCIVGSGAGVGLAALAVAYAAVGVACNVAMGQPVYAGLPREVQQLLDSAGLNLSFLAPPPSTADIKNEKLTFVSIAAIVGVLALAVE